MSRVRSLSCPTISPFWQIRNLSSPMNSAFPEASSPLEISGMLSVILFSASNFVE